MTKLLMTPDYINQVYDTLKAAQDQLSMALIAKAEADKAMADAEARAHSEGLEGKNKEQREANLRLALADEYAAAHKAELEYYNARSLYEVADADRSRVDKLLRLMEVGKDD